MEKKNNLSNIGLGILLLIVIIVSGYLIIGEKPATEQKLMTPVPSEKNNFQYEPSPCLNSEGVIVQCKG